MKNYRLVLPMFAVVLFAASLTMTGCRRAQPVYDVVTTGVPTYDGARDIYTAIMGGLSAKGWRIIEDSPGAVLAEVSAGGHQAVVELTYDDQSYAISHVESSPGLRFDGHTIHRRYNHWVRLLNERIRHELGELAMR